MVGKIHITWEVKINVVALYLLIRYLPDMMNALQGVYIFWAFVLSRKTLKIIFGSKTVDHMDRAVARVYT